MTIPRKSRPCCLCDRPIPAGTECESGTSVGEDGWGRWWAHVLCGQVLDYILTVDRDRVTDPDHDAYTVADIEPDELPYPLRAAWAAHLESA